MAVAGLLGAAIIYAVSPSRGQNRR